MTSAILRSCDVTSRNNGKLHSLCYDLQQSLPSLSTERQELFKLIELISDEDITFSTLNFFKLDRGTLLQFFTVLAGYLIVCLQLNESRL